LWSLYWYRFRYLYICFFFFIFDKVPTNCVYTEHSNETRAESMFLWCKMLLPNSEKRIYNLQSKQLIKLYSQVKIIFLFYSLLHKYINIINIYNKTHHTFFFRQPKYILFTTKSKNGLLYKTLHVKIKQLYHSFSCRW